jgi:hypothetical protein
MPLIVPVLSWVIVIVGVTCIVIANFIFYLILEEVM